MVSQNFPGDVERKCYVMLNLMIKILYLFKHEYSVICQFSETDHL